MVYARARARLLTPRPVFSFFPAVRKAFGSRLHLPRVYYNNIIARARTHTHTHLHARIPPRAPDVYAARPTGARVCRWNILCGGGRDEERAMHVCACLAETLTPSSMNESDGGRARARARVCVCTLPTRYTRLFVLYIQYLIYSVPL